MYDVDQSINLHTASQNRGPISHYRLAANDTATRSEREGYHNEAPLAKCSNLQDRMID